MKKVLIDSDNEKDYENIEGLEFINWTSIIE